VQLEDALRTSSKPAALLHRHVLVRRLRLRAPGAASALSLSRQLEQAWQRIAALATPLDAAADADEAVWAPSEAAARAALVLRWARGESPTAWFWQRIAAPAGETVVAWPRRALRLMLAPLAADGPRGSMVLPGGTRATRPAAPALRPVLQALAAAGTLPRLAAALTAAEARQLLAVIEAEAQAAAVWLPLPAERAAMQAASGRPASAGVLAQASQVLQARLTPLAEAPPPLPRPALPPSSADLQCVPPPADDVPLPDALALQSPPDPHAVVTARRPPAHQATSPGAAVALPDALDTEWAGLWLLLPLLLRCGLDEDDAPLMVFAQVLQTAPDVLHIPADDPVRWSIAALDLPLVDAPGPWLRRARLAALRDARLPLRRIALRHGTVHLSDVRLDLVFPARAADVRIRRAGFDLDPGFVPWLGRIVRIHYA
jgi:hypothetical protein